MTTIGVLGYWANGLDSYSHSPIPPFTHFPLAASDASVIIYLLIAFFWAIAKLATLAKRSKRRAPGAPEAERPRPVMSAELKEMLETLTGQKLEIPEPRPIAPPPPVPTHHRPQRPTNRRQKQVERRPERPVFQQAPREELMPLPELPDLDLTVPVVSLGQQQRASAMSMTSQPVVTTSFRTSLMGSAKSLTPPDWAPDLKSRAGLRNAILSQIIFGPPKAMERQRFAGET